MTDSVDIRNGFASLRLALLGSTFSIRPVPVCVWFLAKNKNADAKRGFRVHRKQTLFIDARKLQLN